jgi:hypothetical protein
MPASTILGPASQWLKISGKIGGPKIARITFQLLEYEGLPAADLTKRMAVLKKLIATCRELRAAARSAAEDSPVATIEADVEITMLHAMKELRIIEGAPVRTAADRWKTVQKVFGPSGGQVGRTNTLTANASDVSSDDNYWLEAADPLHRSWGHESKRIFEGYLDSQTRMSFWEWLDLQDGFSLPKHFVSYLDPEERWRYWVVFQSGRMWRFNYQRQLIPFDTGENSTLFSGRGFAIWVMSPQGVFYTGDHLQSQFHHSSFLAGRRIAAAGEWAVNKGGQLVFINHKTGHYHCTPHQLYNAMAKLRDNMRIDVSQTAVCLKDHTTNRYTFVRGRAFLQSGGNLASIKSNFGGIFDKDRKFKEPVLELERRSDWDGIYDLIKPIVRTWVEQHRMPI